MSRARELNNRRVQLKDEVLEELKSVLTRTGKIDVDFEDSAGNEIETVSLKWVKGDAGNTKYPLDELSLCDALEVLFLAEHILDNMVEDSTT